MINRKNYIYLLDNNEKILKTNEELTMNRHILFFVLVGLQINIVLSSNDPSINEKKDLLQDTPLILAIKSHPEMQKMIAAIRVIHNSINKKIDYYTGNNPDEQKRINIDRFKTPCNKYFFDFLMKKSEKKSEIDGEAIKIIQDLGLSACVEALSVAKNASYEAVITGGLSFLLKDPIEDEVFKKMAETLETFSPISESVTEK